MVLKSDSYPVEIQEQITKLSHKMLILGFAGIFEKMEEGPIVRTFFFRPSQNSLYSKVLNKEEEIAGTLGVETVMIERAAAYLSISVPRADRQMIRFDSCIHELLTSPITRDMALPILMGQNTKGEFLYADLAEQPHLLIAGATGSGKSIFTSQMIASLALFRDPKELSFTLVDTKNLDLVFFEELKHVSSVVKDVDELRTTLEKTLTEVRRRNQLMSGFARNIKEWNSLSLSTGAKLKYKIIIIDEFADVILQDESAQMQLPRKERDTPIMKLVQQIAQISRAAGVHVVMATQRPSVKIIDGDIKANFPARICFKLPGSADSRVVLDVGGAENLLGKGDYLYKIAGSDVIKRAHSAFVTTNDIAMVIDHREEILRSYIHV